MGLIDRCASLMLSADAEVAVPAKRGLLCGSDVIVCDL